MYSYGYIHIVKRNSLETLFTASCLAMAIFLDWSSCPCLQRYARNCLRTIGEQLSLDELFVALHLRDYVTLERGLWPICHIGAAIGSDIWP